MISFTTFCRSFCFYEQSSYSNICMLMLHIGLIEYGHNVYVIFIICRLFALFITVEYLIDQMSSIHQSISFAPEVFQICEPDNLRINEIFHGSSGYNIFVSGSLVINMRTRAKKPR